MSTPYFSVFKKPRFADITWLFTIIFITYISVFVSSIYSKQNESFHVLTSLYQASIAPKKLNVVSLSIPSVIKISVNNVEVYQRDANRKHYSLTQRTLRSDNMVLVFEQPLIVMISMLTFWLGSVVLIVTWVLFRRRETLIAEKLADVEALETWAGKFLANEKTTPLIANNVPTKAINQLLTQLDEALHKDSQFDHLLREKALIDKATGIGNRQFLDNRLEAFLREGDARGVVLLMQLHEGELIQKLYGEDAALALLNDFIKSISHRLEPLPYSFIARRGDYELAMLLPEMFISEAEKLAERMLKNLQTIQLPVGINKDEFIHIGLCYFNGNESAYQIMAEADMALRSAQLQGPNQCFSFDSDEVQSDTAMGSLKWRTLLELAIKHNAFELHAQPVIDNESNDKLHDEIFVKLKDNDDKLISARVFLPMAKKCGLTASIDQLVVEQLYDAIHAGKISGDFSLNLSVDALLSADFQRYFFDKIAQSPEVAKHLIIEISEYHLSVHLIELQAVLTKMHRYGVRLLVDKVGQYVVNANYLKRCPFSFIKLHRSIVLDIHEKPENQLFIQSLRTMCDYEAVKIFALGVETKNEWESLIALGVDGGQGHYFAQPNLLGA